MDSIFKKKSYIYKQSFNLLNSQNKIGGFNSTLFEKKHQSTIIKNTFKVSKKNSSNSIKSFENIDNICKNKQDSSPLKRRLNIVSRLDSKNRKNSCIDFELENTKNSNNLIGNSMKRSIILMFLNFKLFYNINYEDKLLDSLSNQKKTPEDIKEISKFLQQLPIVNKLLSKSKDSLSKSILLDKLCYSQRYEIRLKNTILFIYGNIGNKFYTVYKGNVAVLVPFKTTVNINSLSFVIYLLRLRHFNEHEVLRLSIEINKTALVGVLGAINLSNNNKTISYNINNTSLFTLDFIDTMYAICLKHVPILFLESSDFSSNLNTKEKQSEMEESLNDIIQLAMEKDIDNAIKVDKTLDTEANSEIIFDNNSCKLLGSVSNIVKYKSKNSIHKSMSFIKKRCNEDSLSYINYIKSLFFIYCSVEEYSKRIMPLKESFTLPPKKYTIYQYKQVKIFSKGESFGEVALEDSKSKRTATCIATYVDSFGKTLPDILDKKLNNNNCKDKETMLKKTKAKEDNNISTLINNNIKETIHFGVFTRDDYNDSLKEATEKLNYEKYIILTSNTFLSHFSLTNFNKQLSHRFELVVYDKNTIIFGTKGIVIDKNTDNNFKYTKISSKNLKNKQEKKLSLQQNAKDHNSTKNNYNKSKKTFFYKSNKTSFKENNNTLCYRSKSALDKNFIISNKLNKTNDVKEFDINYANNSELSININKIRYNSCLTNIKKSDLVNTSKKKILNTIINKKSNSINLSETKLKIIKNNSLKTNSNKTNDVASSKNTNNINNISELDNYKEIVYFTINGIYSLTINISLNDLGKLIINYYKKNIKKKEELYKNFENKLNYHLEHEKFDKNFEKYYNKKRKLKLQNLVGFNILGLDDCLYNSKYTLFYVTCESNDCNIYTIGKEYIKELCDKDNLCNSKLRKFVKLRKDHYINKLEYIYNTNVDFFFDNDLTKINIKTDFFNINNNNSYASKKNSSFNYIVPSNNKSDLENINNRNKISIFTVNTINDSNKMSPNKMSSNKIIIQDVHNNLNCSNFNTHLSNQNKLINNINQKVIDNSSIKKSLEFNKLNTIIKSNKIDKNSNSIKNELENYSKNIVGKDNEYKLLKEDRYYKKIDNKYKTNNTNKDTLTIKQLNEFKNINNDNCFNSYFNKNTKFEKEKLLNLIKVKNKEFISKEITSRLSKAYKEYTLNNNILLKNKSLFDFNLNINNDNNLLVNQDNIYKITKYKKLINKNKEAHSNSYDISSYDLSMLDKNQFIINSTAKELNNYKKISNQVYPYISNFSYHNQINTINKQEESNNIRFKKTIRNKTIYSLGKNNEINLIYNKKIKDFSSVEINKDLRDFNNEDIELLKTIKCQKKLVFNIK